MWVHVWVRDFKMLSNFAFLSIVVTLYMEIAVMVQVGYPLYPPSGMCCPRLKNLLRVEAPSYVDALCLGIPFSCELL